MIVTHKFALKSSTQLAVFGIPLGAEVGFMETVIRVSERNRSVELCAVVQDATLERGVTVTLSTRGGSAAGMATSCLHVACVQVFAVLF